jgi:type I site-specific restriction endonuclease
MSKPEDHLADAIVGLTAELAVQRVERERNHVTKLDLAEAEQRIIAAIVNQISAADLRALERIDGRISRLAILVRKLDEQI